MHRGKLKTEVNQVIEMQTMIGLVDNDTSGVNKLKIVLMIICVMVMANSEER